MGSKNKVSFYNAVMDRLAVTRPNMKYNDKQIMSKKVNDQFMKAGRRDVTDADIDLACGTDSLRQKNFKRNG